MSRCGFTILLLIALALPAAGADNDVGVLSTVDRSIITVGDPIYYTLTVSWREGIELTHPSLGINLGKFEIQDYETGEPEKAGDRQVLTSSYRITVYETGEFEIPGLEISYRDASGNARTVNTEAIRILVESVSPDMAGSILDIKAPADMGIDPLPYVLAAAAVLFLAVSAALGIMIYRRWRLKRMLSAGVRFRAPAHELAMKRLNELRDRDLISAGMLKEYYTEISEILREYMENRYTLYALERTTGEIMSEATGIGLAEGLYKSLGGLLETCDMVKFARHEPEPESHNSAFQDARGFVDATKLMPEVQPGDGAETPSPAPVPGDEAVVNGAGT